VLSESDIQLLTGPNPAIVTTLRQDGSPHSTILWIDWEDEWVLINTAVGRAKERHLRQDPRVSVCVHAANDMYRYLVVEGEVELTTDGAAEHADRLWRRYRGIGFVGPANEQRIIARLRPTRVYSYSQETPGQDQGALPN
jgi:PPOX class probable F420-dependent enzyme